MIEIKNLTKVYKLNKKADERIQNKRAIEKVAVDHLEP